MEHLDREGVLLEFVAEIRLASTFDHYVVKPAYGCEGVNEWDPTSASADTNDGGESMKKLLALGAVAAIVAAMAGPIASRASAVNEYVGTQYDLGGTTTPIDGAVPAVDTLADEITQATDLALADVAARRATLPYGQIYPDPGAPAQLVTYPKAPGRVASDQYSVTVKQGAQSSNSHVDKVLARKTDTNKEKDTSWTSFSFAGTVDVAVKKLKGTPTGCLVRPASAQIATVFASGTKTCTFTLTRSANLSVEFLPNTTNPVLNPMLVFANPPEVNVPPANDPNVLYLGPGFHDLGSGIQLRSNQTVYIAGGAWVRAAFVGLNVQNVVIKGRGVIDGIFLDLGDQEANKDQPGLIDIQQSSNVVIDGITLVNGPRFNVRAIGDHDTIHNVKIISWWYSTDGIVGGNKSLIEDNFIKVNDDSIKLFWGDTIARRNVVWQLANGGPFMISWNITQVSANFRVYDNDVIHAEHDQLPPQAIFRARHAGSGHMQRYLFENIRVEDASWRLFYIILENNKWFDPVAGFGQISDLVFRNITATTSFRNPSVIQGIDSAHKVYNVNLIDVFMNGVCVTTAAGGNFQIAPASTDQIRLMKKKVGSSCPA